MKYYHLPKSIVTIVNIVQINRILGQYKNMRLSLDMFQFQLHISTILRNTDLEITCFQFLINF